MSVRFYKYLLQEKLKHIWFLAYQLRLALFSTNRPALQPIVTIMPVMMKKLSYRKQVARQLRTQYVEGMIGRRNNDNKLSRFHRTPERDGRVDRQNCYQYLQAVWWCWRGKTSRWWNVQGAKRPGDKTSSEGAKRPGGETSINPSSRPIVVVQAIINSISWHTGSQWITAPNS